MNYAYQQKGGVNVLEVNWAIPALKMLYPQAAANTKCIGKLVANLILYLTNTCNISCANIHIIGHSLGAHIAGFAGKELQKITLNKCVVGRITGLDAAGPGFQTCTCTDRLCKGDATFVDGIHTNNLILGISKLYANINVFPNGGIIQPECTTFSSNPGK